MAETTVHELKIWPSFFEAVWDGRKTFEVRKNDRNFEVGDFLHLKEYDPKKKCYTGSFVIRQITYILSGFDAAGLSGVQEGYCVLGLSRAAKPEAP